MTRFFDAARLWALLLMLAGSMGAYHVHRGAVIDFPGRMQLVKDHGAMTVAQGCAPGNECAFIGPVRLGMAAQFSNVDYSCAANQTGGAYLYPGLVFECYPLTTSTFALTFHNATATDLSGVLLEVSFSALGQY